MNLTVEFVVVCRVLDALTNPVGLVRVLVVYIMTQILLNLQMVAGVRIRGRAEAVNAGMILTANAPLIAELPQPRLRPVSREGHHAERVQYPAAEGHKAALMDALLGRKPATPSPAPHLLLR